MDSGLADRVVLVTGASGGIGGEIARAFAAEGARVVVHFGHQGDRARNLAKELGPRCVALGADVTSETDVHRLFVESESTLGPVEVLVANAGAWPPANVPVAQMTLEQWRRTLDVNLTSVFLCMREFFQGILRHQIAEPAAVIISSTAGIFGEAGHVDYASAKAGIAFGMARTLKNEIGRLSPLGRVNVVCPGWTRSDMTADFSARADQVRGALQTMPLRKIGRPRDIAAAVIYLASSRLAGHVTGQILTVAGGMEGRVLYQPDEIDTNIA
jgi:3-oxoacyl-[acyl-carrier protein] reductase